MSRLALYVVLALALVVGAAACGGGEDVGTGPESVSTTGPEGTDSGATTTDESETTDTEAGGETTTGGGGEGEGDAANGKKIFASAGCVGCHTLSDAGANGNIGPNLDEEKPDYELVVERVTNGMGAMPSFKDQLNEQEIQDVAAYVSSVAGS
jgi:cytochrome c553